MLSSTLKQENNHQYHIGITLMLLSSACIALSSLLGKQLVLALALPIVLLLRYLISALILWWIALLTNLPRFNKQWILHHSIRAALGVLSQYALFYYLTYGSILDGTLLFMTSPLFVPLLSRILFKTRIQKRQWVCLIIGFVGVAFILQPTHKILDWHAFIGLASGLFNAGSQVYYHKIIKQSDVKSATLYMYTLSTLLVLVPAVIFWHPLVNSLLSLNVHDTQMTYSTLILLLICLAVIGISNKTFRGKAYGKVNNPGSLTPFLYTAIIFASLLDWLIYDIVPDYLSIIGVLLIISSGLVLSLNKFTLNKFKQLIEEV